MNFYRDAGVILDQLDRRMGTVKGLCLQDKRKVSRNLLLVLLHDLLFRRRGIQAPDGPIKQMILAHQPRFKAELDKIRRTRGALSNSELIEGSTKNRVAIPRYVRVNTILTSTDAVIASFSKVGYELVTLANIDWRDKRSLWICRDPHVDDVLWLPPGTDLHKHPLVTSGNIILQDKASCFTAFVLKPKAGSHVIDACAAPGNKTSHLAMLMGNSGTIWALDLDARRLNTLRALTQRAKASIIQPMHANFLELDVNSPQFEKVESILLDPSCSGSGIVNRLDALVDSSEAATRLLSLAAFQIKMIEHALKFPNVRRVAYSTCSIHALENEDVVATILASHGEHWHLQPALPSWPRRGIASARLNQEQAKCLVRCDPTQDATNGFFVALFERKGLGPSATPITDARPSAVPRTHPSTADKLPPQTNIIITKRSVSQLESKKRSVKRAPTSKKAKIRRSVTS
ncbi:hypothetical protein L0F63_005398 [Massospora cicadina]|nr:hypothetical protein L0F63_005398 [Massospora cicadina]